MHKCCKGKSWEVLVGQAPAGALQPHKVQSQMKSSDFASLVQNALGTGKAEGCEFLFVCFV